MLKYFLCKNKKIDDLWQIWCFIIITGKRGAAEKKLNLFYKIRNTLALDKKNYSYGAKDAILCLIFLSSVI